MVLELTRISRCNETFLSVTGHGEHGSTLETHCFQTIAKLLSVLAGDILGSFELFPPQVPATKRASRERFSSFVFQRQIDVLVMGNGIAVGTEHEGGGVVTCLGENWWISETDR